MRREILLTRPQQTLRLAGKLRPHQRRSHLKNMGLTLVLRSKQLAVGHSGTAG
jgi:hypothetical protein